MLRQRYLTIFFCVMSFVKSSDAQVFDSLSIYNIYSRANPYFIYYDQEGSATAGTLKISAKQVSLFPIIPAVTWNIHLVSN